MEQVYRKHARTVYRYLLSCTHDKNIADWLCAIAKNSPYGYRRKHPTSDKLDEHVVWGQTLDESFRTSESHVELLKKLHSLHEEVREVMYLPIFGDLSLQKIGDILSKAENWARVTFYCGKEKLKKELNADGK